MLINPNIATVQTSREDASSVDVERHKSEPIADHVYLLPVTADNVRHILDKEKNIDGAGSVSFIQCDDECERGPNRLKIGNKSSHDLV